jgi:hypothetical protein
MAAGGEPGRVCEPYGHAAMLPSLAAEGSKSQITEVCEQPIGCEAERDLVLARARETG